MAGFAGLIAGFDVKVDLCAFRKKRSNIPLEMFGDGVSLRDRQCRRHSKAEPNPVETS